MLRLESFGNTSTQQVTQCDVARSGTIRVYSYRWLILALYSMTVFSNTLVWVSLYTVSDATVAYYNITVKELLWSSSAISVMQVLFAVPLNFIPSRLGLRITMALGAILNALGACILIASTHRGGFPFFVVGQVVIGLAATILPQMAPEVSAVWFGENEQALSTSIGITVNIAGGAVGFLLPSLMISNIDPEKHMNYITEKYEELIYSQAALCILLLVLILIFFRKGPVFPPTLFQAMRPEHGNATFSSFINTYVALLKNKNYLLCANSFALNYVLIGSIPLLINGIISWKFPFHDATVGWMGFGGTIAGVGGSIAFSIALDKTKAYKKMIITLGLVTLFFWVCFTEVLSNWSNLPLCCALFVVTLFTGFPFGPILVDMITEIIYPIPESMSFVLAITAGRIYCIPIVFLLGYLMDQKYIHVLCLFIAGIVALSVVLVFFPKVQINRTEVGKDSSYEQL